MRQLPRGCSRGAFTLLEVLVVIGIVAVLAAILLPAVQAAREAARRVHCSNNLKQIGLALHNYHNNVGAFPPLLTHNSIISPDTGYEQGWYSWLARILPLLEQQPLYDQLGIDHDAVLPFFTARTKEQVSTNLSVYLCPSDPYSERIWTGDWGFPEELAAAHTNYLGLRGSSRVVPGNGAFPITNRCTRIADIQDGTSNTLFVGERPIDQDGEWGWWALGTGFDGNGLADHVLDCSEGLYRGVPGSADDLTHFWSMHKGGAYFVSVDCSVHLLPYTIDRNSFQALGSRNGGEVVSEL
jgi:prepilin-type N-terminal cleavage/methylation domain-containing protein